MKQVRTLLSGRGSRLVKTPIRQLASGRYALDVHRTGTDPSFVACANLG